MTLFDVFTEQLESHSIFLPDRRKKLFQRKTKPSVYYWDMRILGDYWDCFDGSQRVYHHTISATLIYGLRTALAQLAEEGLPASWARHAAAADRFRRGLWKRGLECYVEDPHYQLSTIISIKPPLGVDCRVLTTRAMNRWVRLSFLCFSLFDRNCCGNSFFFCRYKIEISGGLGPTVGKVLRVGLMGINADPRIVDRVLDALDDALAHQALRAKL